MDFELHYDEKGSGEPLILLHGNGEDSAYFVNQVEFFSHSYRVICVDTRGHGKSPRGSAPFTIRQFADDLRELMDQLSLKKADILGFSDGGNIALIFAMKYPEKVDRLIVDGANLNPQGVKAAVQIPIDLAYRFTSFLAGFDNNALPKAEMLGLMVVDPNIPIEDLAKIKAPTLVMAGTNDMIKHEHTLEISQSITGSQTVFIEGDHFIAAGNPAEFNAAVDKFLNETR